MTRNEFNQIFTKIRNEYNDFEGDYDDWYGVLQEYSYQDILKKLNERMSTTAPIHINLVKGLKKEEKVEDWITECDLCKQKIVIHNNDMTEFDKHYRRCQKIDFIDRINFNYKQRHITMAVYYEMSDEELEENYRKTMNYYLEHRDLNNIFKKMP